MRPQSPASVQHFQEPLFSQGPELPSVHFNVLRRLPEVGLRHKWVGGEIPRHPLPVQTASLPTGVYSMRVETVPDGVEGSELESLFVEFVLEYGVWVIGDGMSLSGPTKGCAPNALIPGLHGWADLSHEYINGIEWRVR